MIVTTSQRVVDLARTSVENGLATQMALAQAEVNLASARYACEAALYDGEFAMGCR
ncbi:TolC family protein [Treponema ruminis]|uniref:TolC family protein n=1 Tax=Treponema ruminis TaxID=744515 RepID=UPI00352E3295